MGIEGVGTFLRRKEHTVLSFDSSPRGGLSSTVEPWLVGNGVFGDDAKLPSVSSCDKLHTVLSLSSSCRAGFGPIVGSWLVEHDILDESIDIRGVPLSNSK